MDEEKELKEELVEEEEEKETEKETEVKSHTFLNICIIIAILIVLLFAYAKFMGTKGLVVKEYRVESSVLTKNFSGLKIVHFSDLLYRSTFDNNDIDNLVDRINTLKPDIIVFTGDLTNKITRLKEEDKNYLISKLTMLNATIGKYYIYGDNDFSNIIYEDIMDASNFKLLNNSYEEIFYNTNDSIYIVGIPSSIKENIYVDEAFKFYDDEDRKYIILLVHDGNTIKFIDESNYEVDLILGGHSLNGSVVLPFVGGIFSEGNNYKYSENEYDKGITKIYMSSGLGTGKYGYRFLNKPSFNLYRLKALSN